VAQWEKGVFWASIEPKRSTQKPIGCDDVEALVIAAVFNKEMGMHEQAESPIRILRKGLASATAPVRCRLRTRAGQGTCEFLMRRQEPVPKVE